MNTWLFQTTGDEDPRPGTATFHFTFFVVLHSVGGDASVEEPLPNGPRQCDHSLALTIGVASDTTISSDLRTRLPVDRPIAE
jgi:hypothetical protein